MEGPRSGLDRGHFRGRGPDAKPPAGARLVQGDGAGFPSVNLTWLLFALAVLSGVAVAAQSGVNAMLARGVGSPVHAALVSFAVGTLALLVVAFARRDAIPARAAMAALPWWAWIGGVLGAAYITMAVVAAPRLGAGSLVAAVIAGQLAAAVAIDHFGWLGFPGRAYAGSYQISTR
jgi:transporter family-2 protein